MALPLVASAAFAALGLWAAGAGEGAPVPDVVDAPPSDEDLGEGLEEALLRDGAQPHIPTKPIDIPRPIIGDLIDGPRLDDVAAREVEPFVVPIPEPALPSTVAGTATAGALVAAYMKGSDRSSKVPAGYLVKGPTVVRSSLGSDNAVEALTKATYAATKLTRSSKAAKVPKDKKGGGGHWIELALLVVAGAILLSRPRVVDKVKEVFQYSGSSNKSSKPKRAKSSKRAAAAGSPKPKKESEAVAAPAAAVVENVSVSQTNNTSTVNNTVVVQEKVQGGAFAAQGDSETSAALQVQLRNLQNVYYEDTAKLRRSLKQATRELAGVKEQLEERRAVEESEQHKNLGTSTDVAALRRELRTMSDLHELLRRRYQKQSSQLKAARALVGDLSMKADMSRRQMRHKMDVTMALIKGEVITLDWPGIELVSRLLREMKGGWQLNPDDNKLKEQTFKSCHDRLHKLVVEFEGPQEEGAHWRIANMKEFLHKIPSDRHQELFLTLQRLVVAYDTMGHAAKNDMIAAKEMVVNVGTLLDMARYTQYRLTRKHQGRSYYGSVPDMAGSADSSFYRSPMRAGMSASLENIEGVTHLADEEVEDAEAVLDEIDGSRTRVRTHTVKKHNVDTKSNVRRAIMHPESPSADELGAGAGRK